MNAADIYCSVATCTVTLIMPTATGHCNDELPTATGHCNDEPSGSVTTVKKGLVPRVPFQFNAMQVHGRESSQTCVYYVFVQCSDLGIFLYNKADRICWPMLNRHN
jgi:hypothetical protein